jgi:hypothetical protein
MRPKEFGCFTAQPGWSLALPEFAGEVGDMVWRPIVGWWVDFEQPTHEQKPVPIALGVIWGQEYDIIRAPDATIMSVRTGRIYTETEAKKHIQEVIDQANQALEELGRER